MLKDLRFWLLLMILALGVFFDGVPACLRNWCMTQYGLLSGVRSLALPRYLNSIGRPFRVLAPTNSGGYTLVIVSPLLALCMLLLFFFNGNTSAFLFFSVLAYFAGAGILVIFPLDQPEFKA
ncbi:hypothetical protein KCP73_19820 [Salmonella enterica subsp. enterica]|nr:hypothetical protein KCP73_19820 [Salmonella enterica subsp. enterica]